MTRPAARWILVLATLFVASSALAATYTASQTGNWSAAATWGGAGVPGPSDNAVISNSYAVTLDTAVSVAGFSMSAGTLDGSNNLTVTSSFNWSGGMMQGAGATNIAATVTSSTISGSTTKYFLRNLNLNANTTYTSTVYSYGAGSTITVGSGVTFDIQTDQTFYYYCCSNGATSIVAVNGTITKSAGTGTAQFDWVVNNSGTINANSGTLNLNAGGTHTGAFAVASGATLAFTSGTHTASGAFSGSGTLSVSGGTTTVSGSYGITGAVNVSGGTLNMTVAAAPASVTVSNGTANFSSITSSPSSLNITSSGTLNINGSAISTAALTLDTNGTLSGSADVTITSTFAWNGGNLSGTGTATVANTVTSSVIGGVYGKGLYRNLVLNANTTYTSTTYMYGAGGATLTVSSGVTLDLQSDQNFYYYCCSSGANATVAVNGTLTKSAASGITQFDWAVNNAGTVNANSGTLVFGGGGTSTGTVNIAATATFAVNTATYTASGTIAGTGSVKVTGGTLAATGTFSATGPIAMSGGTFTISGAAAPSAISMTGGALTLASLTTSPTVSISNSSTLTINGSAVSIPSLTLADSSTITGAANITVTSSFLWSGGTMSGAGSMTIASTVTSSVINGGYVKYFLRSINFNANTTYASTVYAYGAGGATVTIPSGVTFDLQTDQNFYYYCCGQGSNPTLSIAGTLTKSAGTGSASIGWTLANSGTINVNSGTLYIDGGGTSSGTMTVASGATLATSNNPLTSSGTISGAGTLAVSGSATLTVNGIYSVSGPIAVSSGTLNVTVSASPSTITVSGGSATFATIGASPSSIDLSNGGSLTINGAAVSTPVLNLANSATLGGSANLTVTTTFNWTGGVMTGSGSTTVANTATSSAITGAYVHYFYRNITFNVNTTYAPTVYSYGAGGTITISSGVTFDIQTDQNFYYACCSSANNTLAVAGTLTKSAAAGTTQIDWIVNNTGTVNVNSGTLSFTAGGTDSGAFAIVSGATLNFNGGTHTTSGAISGAGSVAVSNGQLDVNGSYTAAGTLLVTGGTANIANAITPGTITVSGGTLNLNGTTSTPILNLNQSGTIAGTGSLTATTTFSWTGGTFSGTGTTTIANTVTSSTIGGSYVHYFYRNINFNANTSYAPTVYSYGAGGTITIASGVTFDIQTDQNFYYACCSGANNVLAVAGILTKSAGTGTTDIGWVVNNSGTVNANSGTLSLSAGGTDPGAFAIASGKTLQFAGGTHTTSGAFTGAGNVTVSNGQLDVNGSYTAAGTLSLSAGTANVANAITPGAINVTGGTLNLNATTSTTSLTLAQSGTIAGSGNLTATGTFSWTGGTFSGTGSTTVANTATSSTITGAYVHYFYRNITFNANTTYNTTVYAYGAGGTITIPAGVTFDIQNDQPFYYACCSGNNTIALAGTLTKSAGTGSTDIGWIVNNAGTVNANSGTLNFTAGGTDSGAFAIASGATLLFAGGTHTTSGAFTGAGNVTVSNGQLDVNGSYTAAGTLSVGGGTANVANAITPGAINVSGGTLNLNATTSTPSLTLAQYGTIAGSGNLTATGTFAWSGGTFSGSGSTTIASTVTSSAITGTGAYIHYFYRNITFNANTTYAPSVYSYGVGGTITIPTGVTFDIQTDQPFYYACCSGANNVLALAGTLTKSAGTGTMDIGWIVNNSGTVNVISGTLSLSAGGSGAGTFAVASGKALQFAGGTHTTSGPFTGAGNVTVSSGQLDLNGSYSVTGSLSVSGGTMNVAGSLTSPSAIAVSGGTLNLNGTSSSPALTLSQSGTVGGSGALTVTGTFAWSGGTMSGTGSTTIANTVTSSVIDGAYIHYFYRPITFNANTTYAPTVYAYGGSAATITVGSGTTFDIQTDQPLYYACCSGNASLIVNGSLAKSAGTGTTQFDWPVTNNQTIKAVAGTLNFNGGLTENGSLYYPITSDTSYGKIAVSGAFALGGSLLATPVGAYIPVAGTTFPILTYGSYSGTFASKTLTYSGGSFNDGYSATTLTLTAQNVSCATAPTGIVSWWRGEGNANDSFGPNNGTLVNGATTAAAQVGQGFSLNGSTQYVSVADSTSLHAASVSAEAWVKFSSAPSGTTIILAKPYASGTQDSICLWLQSGQLLAGINLTAPGSLSTSFNPTIGTWYHVAFTYDASTGAATLYLNGSAVSNTTQAAPILYDSHPLLIGADVDSGSTFGFFPGIIDEVTLYNRPLSAGEVLNVYNASSAGKCYTAPAAPTITGITPSSGAPGTSVVITGTNLFNTSAVAFNGTPAASFTVDSATQITAVVATGSTTGFVTATTLGGTATSPSAFTVGITATISSFTPVHGRATGGTSVTLSGSALDTVTSVTFGGTAASISSQTATSLVAVTPAHASGAVNVSATNAYGTATASAQYTFDPPPALTAIRNTSGSTAGAGGVILTGTNLDNVTAVTFGGSPATIIYTSATELTVAAPAHAAGAVTVTVTDGTTPSSLVNAFSYVANDDIARDFFVASNATRWTYGSEPSRGGTFTPFTTFAHGSNGMDGWPSGGLPAVSRNSSAGTVQQASNFTPSMQMNLHPGSSGENAVIRWTSQAAGNYRIQGYFDGRDASYPTTTDDAILLNNSAASPLFTTNVTDYNVQHPFDVTVSLAAGDTIEFTVGFGGNGYSGDATGVSATISTAAAADLTPSFASVPATAVAGTPFNVTLGATNAGGGASTSATWNATVSGGSVNSITWTAPWTSCTNTATTISCSASSLAASSTAPVSANITPASAGTLTISATVSASNDSNSANDTGSASVTVSAVCPPAPTISPSGTVTICSGQSTTLTASAGASSYAWSLNGTPLGLSTQAITVTAAGSYTVTATSGSCSATSAATTVAVSSTPAPAITTSASSVCANGSGTASTAVVSGATYFWTLTNGSITSGQGTNAIAFNAASAGNVSLTVSVTNSNNCTGSASAAVTIDAQPNATIAAPASVCPGGSATASVTPVAGATYNWSATGGTIVSGLGTPSVTFNAPASGAVSLNVTVTNGACSASSGTSVPVAAPAAVGISAPANACPNANVSASVASQTGATYNWVLSGAAIASGQGTNSITFTTPAAGSVGISVSVTNGGCTANGNATTSVTASASISITAPASACANSAVNASISPIGGATYNWSVTNAAIVSGQGTNAITFSAPAAGSVTLTVNVTSGGCTSSRSSSLAIGSVPSPVVTPGSATVCANGNGTASTSAVTGASYAWTITNGTITGGQGTSAVAFTAGASGSVSLSVTVTSSSGCSGSASASIAINPPPDATITAPASACPNATVNASVAPLAGATFNWTVTGATITGGQGTNAISFTAPSSGSVTIAISESRGGCTSTASATTSVGAPPPLTISAPANACAASSVTASVPPQPGASFVWTLTGATVATGQGTNSITFTAPSSGNVTVAVSMTSGGCTSSASTTVTVASLSLTLVAPSSAAAGSSSNTASIDNVPGAAYAWTITNGTIVSGQGTNLIRFTAGPSGSVSIGVTVTSGTCSASKSTSVTITAPPVQTADLALSMSASPNVVAPNGAVTFTVLVKNNGPNDAAGVSVHAALSGGTFISATSTAFTCAGTTCNAASLPSGTTATITITTNAPATGTSITASSNVTSSTTDPVLSNNTASATATIAQVTCGTAPASLISPADGASVLSPVTFTWSSVPNATQYDVWIAADAATFSLAGSTAATTLTASVAGKSIEWYVAARFTGDCPAINSAHRTFTVTATSTCDGHLAPTLNAPLGGSVASPVTFSWQASPVAAGYKVWISVDGAALQDIGTTSSATTLTVAVPPGSITWSVDALFAGCPSIRSNSAAFNVAKPDACANRAATTLVAPADNSSHTSSNVTFQWTAVANANGYRLWAAIDGASFNALTTTADTSASAVITAGKVEWYVETLYDGCSSLESAHRTFDVPHALNCGGNGKAANLAPSSDTTKPSVTFTWSPAAGATSYEVWLALENGSPSLLGTTASASLTHDVPQGALEWFVRANFDGCPATESAHAHFAYAPPAACTDDRPLLTSPISGASGVYPPVSFAWKGVTGASAYKLFIANNNGAFSLFATTSAPHLDDAAVPTGTIDWYVEASLPGCTATTSGISRLTVSAKPAGCPTLTAPVIAVPSSASSGVRYTIRWQRVAGAETYVVQSADNAAFNNATSVSTADDHALFLSSNSGSTPTTMYFRVRALAACQPQPGPYSSTTAVVILPSVAITKQFEGSLPADAAEPVTYTIPLDATLAGLTFTATPNQPFITVNPASGIVPAGGLNLTVIVDTSHLAIGTSTAGVTITTSTPAASGRTASASSSSSTTTTVSVSLVSPVVPSSKSTPPPDALIIPAVAHADGVNSRFQSDVRLTNSSPQVMKYQVTFTPTGDAGNADSKQTTVDVDPGKTIALDDILGTWFTSGALAGSIGTLEIRPLTTQPVTANAAFNTLNSLSTFASSRTFNVTSNGTFGQYIPAIPFGSFIGFSKDPKLQSILSLQQIAQSAGYRTNLGFVEGAGQPASLLVSVFGKDGSKVTEFPLDLAAGQHTQFALGSKNVGTLTDGRVEVKVLSPTGKVTAYASVLDNATNDPLLVSPVNLSAAGNTKFVVPGVADLNNGLANWRTDMRVFNASTKPVDATLTFISQSGGEPKSVVMTLAPNEVKTLDNTLADTFGITNDGGAVHITTLQPANVIATARTYNQTTTGTYGQFIPAVTPADASGVGSRPLQVLQLEESDRYRSNVGIAEVSGKPASVVISVVPPDGRVTGSIQLDLQPNEFRQLNSMLKSFGTGTAYNARVTVKVISGEGRVTAYASVIDQVTQDPTFVPAQ